MEKNVGRLLWLLTSVGIGVLSAVAYDAHERSAAAAHWGCSTERWDAAVLHAAETLGDYDTAGRARRDMDRAREDCSRR